MDRLIQTKQGFKTPDQILTSDFSEDMFVFNVTVGDGTRAQVAQYATRNSADVVVIDSSMFQQRIDLIDAIKSVSSSRVVVEILFSGIPSLVEHDLLKQVYHENQTGSTDRSVAFFVLFYK